MKQAIVSFLGKAKRNHRSRTNSTGHKHLGEYQLSVSNFMTQIHSVKQYLSKRVKEFKAGNIQCCVKTWSEITSDSEKCKP